MVQNCDDDGIIILIELYGLERFGARAAKLKRKTGMSNRDSQDKKHGLASRRLRHSGLAVRSCCEVVLTVICFSARLTLKEWSVGGQCHGAVIWGKKGFFMLNC